MPYVNGIEGVRIIRTKYPELKVLMQTVFEDDEKVYRTKLAIHCGRPAYSGTQPQIHIKQCR
ncbi:MAG: hypothetical protein AAB288_05710 [Acidobacteriota bacterium]